MGTKVGTILGFEAVDDSDEKVLVLKVIANQEDSWCARRDSNTRPFDS